MNKEKASALAQGGIDYANALERFGGNATLYERLALKYLEDSHLNRLEQALAEKDIAAAYREAHSLKGVAGNLSFVKLHQTASHISEALNTGDLSAVRTALPSLRHAHEHVIKALKQLKSGQTTAAAKRDDRSEKPLLVPSLPYNKKQQRKGNGKRGGTS